MSVSAFAKVKEAKSFELKVAWRDPAGFKWYRAPFKGRPDAAEDYCTLKGLRFASEGDFLRDEKAFLQATEGNRDLDISMGVLTSTKVWHRDRTDVQATITVSGTKELGHMERTPYFVNDTDFAPFFCISVRPGP